MYHLVDVWVVIMSIQTCMVSYLFAEVGLSYLIILAFMILKWLDILELIKCCNLQPVI